jgi:hypothetical protein
VTKENFIKYIGSEDSLSGYQKSYKLVLLKYIIESLDNNHQASVAAVIEKIRLFYLERANKGLLPDIDVDDRIKNIKESSNYDVFAVMKSQPYKVINDKGFLYLNRNSNGELVFVFNDDLSSSLSSSEFKKLLVLLEKKLQLYYDTKIPLSSNQNTELEATLSQNIDLNKSVDSIENFNVTLKNLLKRKGLFTINDVIEFDNEHGYETLQLLGASAYSGVSKLIANVSLANNNNEIKKCYIRHFFPETNWASFIKFCKNRGFVLIEDLDGFDFNILLLEKGFGKNKVEKIKNHYLEILSDTDQFNEIVTNKTEKQETITIHNSNENLSVSNLKLIGISKSVIKRLLENDIKTIGQLNGFSKVQLLQILGTYKLQEIFDSLKCFSSPLIDIASKTLASLKNDRNFKIYILRSEGFSLQEIADENNCTRERIRQMELIFDNKISPIMATIIENYFEENSTNCISTNEVLEFFDDDDLDKVIMYNLKKSNDYEFLSFADIFHKKSTANQNTTAELYNLAKDFVGDGINLFDELDNLDDMLSNAGYNYITADAFLNLLEECNAQFYGDYVVFGKKSYSFLCCKIVEKYFPNGIKLHNESDLNKLRNLIHQEFGDVDLPDNNHAIASVLARALIISGRGVATSINNVQFEYSTIETIKEFIDESPLNTLYYMEIFNEFEGLLTITTSINNYNYLHGVLQYCFPDEYTFSRDTISKKSGDGIKLSLEERINDILLQAKQPMHKKTIMNNLGACSEAMLVNVAMNSKKVIFWDCNYYNSTDNISFTVEEKDDIRDLIHLILTENSGYCSDGLLFENMQNNFCNFIEKNNIQNRTNLFYVINSMFEGEFQFSRPHICSLEFPTTINAKEIMLLLLGEDPIISHNNFALISKKILWSEITSGFVFSEIEKDTIRISEDEYLKKESFDINATTLNEIKTILNSICNDLGIISAINMYDFSQFPKINYEWNSFLLTSIIEHYDIGFKIVNPKNIDRRYQKSIIVRNDKNYNQLDEIVDAYLIQNGINEISENNLLSFLLLNHLIRKVIPKELYESQIINYADGMFYV